MFVLLKIMDKLHLGYIYPHPQDKGGTSEGGERCEGPCFPFVVQVGGRSTKVWVPGQCSGQPHTVHCGSLWLIGVKELPGTPLMKCAFNNHSF